MFALQNAAGRRRSHCRGLQARARSGLEHRTAKFDLTLALDGDRATGSRGGLEYSTDLFDAADRRPAAGPLRDACWPASSATPGARLADLPLLAAAERQQLSASGTDTGGRPPGGSLHPRAVRGAGRAHARSAVAVVFEERDA